MTELQKNIKANKRELKRLQNRFYESSLSDEDVIEINKKCAAIKRTIRTMMTL